MWGAVRSPALDLTSLRSRLRELAMQYEWHRVAHIYDIALAVRTISTTNETFITNTGQMLDLEAYNLAPFLLGMNSTTFSKKTRLSSQR